MLYCPLTIPAFYEHRRGVCRPDNRLESMPLPSLIQIILKYHWSPKELAGQIQLKYGCRSVSIPPPHM